MAEPSVQGRIQSVFREYLQACLAVGVGWVELDQGWIEKTKKGPVRDGTGPWKGVRTDQKSMQGSR